MPTSRLMGTAMQMLGGGSSLFIFSAIAGEYHLLEWTAINTNIVLSWLYLIVFGSLIAFSCFNYLLHKVSADQVATMNYVNPLVALWLGWMLNNEELTTQSMLAAIIMLTGVVLIIQKRSLN
ncbi:MAG: EamA family transporter, partial [Saprospiraceae bacterium]|nr:EamA family transporter [Saprospiraceae bacterium]